MSRTSRSRACGCRRDSIIDSSETTSLEKSLRCLHARLECVDRKECDIHRRPRDATGLRHAKRAESASETLGRVSVGDAQ